MRSCIGAVLCVLSRPASAACSPEVWLHVVQRECERDFGAVFVATSGVEVIAILIAWLIADEVLNQRVC